MPFIANTDAQRQEMLASIGAEKIEDLFANIPPELRCKGLDIPPGLTEQEVRNRLSALAEHNSSGLISFLGGGFYDHFIPAALNSIVSRGCRYWGLSRLDHQGAVTWNLSAVKSSMLSSLSLSIRRVCSTEIRKLSLRCHPLVEQLTQAQYHSRVGVNCRFLKT